MNDSFATRDELRVGDQTYEIFSLRRLGEQHAIIHPAQRRGTDEPVADVGDHQADFVHVRAEHHAGARFVAGSMLERDQTAQAVRLELVSQIAPRLTYHVTDRGFVTGRRSHRAQSFQVCFQIQSRISYPKSNHTGSTTPAPNQSPFNYVLRNRGSHVPPLPPVS